MFSELIEGEKDSLAESMVRLHFRKGDVIAHHGSVSTSLMILKSGVIIVEEPDNELTTELARLAPGDMFGERGVLINAPEIGDKTALTPAVFYEIFERTVGSSAEERPAIAEELAALLSIRSKNHEALRQIDKLGPDQSMSALSARMRQIFQLPRRHYRPLEVSAEQAGKEVFTFLLELAGIIVALNQVFVIL